MADENPIATRVLYEDDEVRVWDQVIEAGATLGRHTHQHDYALVTVRGKGAMDVAFHDGTGGALGDGLTLDNKRGDVIFVPKGHTETAVNRGADYRAILVEFKR
jgi:quercetin dioxygenase-like cupin family protein